MRMITALENMFPEVSLRCGLTFLQTLGRPIKSESDRKFECHELTHVKKDYCLNMQDFDKTCCVRVLLQESTVFEFAFVWQVRSTVPF